MGYIEQIPEIAALLSGADHVDVKRVEGDVSLREFIAAMMNHQPGYVTFLYGVRRIFVRFLGMRQNGVPQALHLTAAEVPMKIGAKLAFFKVCAAQEDSFMVAEAVDDHLTARLGVVAEPLADNTRFYVLTIVHYHNWAGPVYFNVIRPFHHVVVGGMARAGVNKS